MKHRLYSSIACLSAAGLFRALLLAQAPAPQAPAPAQPSSQAQPAAPAPAPKVSAADLALTNASLNDVVDRLARMLHIVLVLPKEGIAGSISINSYGETRDLDARNLLDMILRINGYGMQQEGDEYRVFKLADAMSQPIPITVNGRDIPEDDRVVLDMVFLKYVSVTELTKVLNEFKGESAKIITYEPANLLFMLDSGRNLHRLRDIIAQFDSDSFNKQRVRIYELMEARPSDVEKELDTILKGISLDSKNSTVHFLAIDSLNLLIAVAPNSGVFETVEDWIKKLDIPAKPPAGAVDDYVYTVLYGRNDCLAYALNQLFNPAAANMSMGAVGGAPGGAYGNYGYGAGGSGAYAGAFGGGYGGGMYGGGGGGGGYGAGAYGGMGGVGGGYGSPNSFTSGFGGSGGCAGMGGFGGMGGAGYAAPTFGGYSALTPLATTQGGQPQAQQQSASGNSNVAVVQAPAATVQQEAPPRIVALPFDNKLIIYADPQKLQTILKMLKELDRPPRQILLDAKIYSVDLTDNFASGIAAYFGNAANNTSGLTLAPPALSLIGGTSTLTAGMLVSKTRELLGALSLNENIGHVHVLSEPSLIATDSIPAAINVGTQVPVLTSQVGTPLQLSGTNAFTQNISGVNTGITLEVNVRINPSGMVTLVVNQEVSSPSGGSSGSASSSTSGSLTPSFSQQTVQTQVLVHDGDTIAIGGLIGDTTTTGTNGIPFLSRLPYVGGLFGSHTYQHERTELILFMTPHVIYDTNDLLQASDELKAKVTKLQKFIKNNE